ncbi:hypothetical protein ACC760_38870, partial [Rhizobium ruizarguesonis]
TCLNREIALLPRQPVFLPCARLEVVIGSRNDGSFLNVTPPPLRLKPDGKASVYSGEWTSEPDEIRIHWRDKGIDIPGANRPSI